MDSLNEIKVSGNKTLVAIIDSYVKTDTDVDEDKKYSDLAVCEDSWVILKDSHGNTCKYYVTDFNPVGGMKILPGETCYVWYENGKLSFRHCPIWVDSKKYVKKATKVDWTSCSYICDSVRDSLNNHHKDKDMLVRVVDGMVFDCRVMF